MTSSASQKKESFCKALTDVTMTVAEAWKDARGAENVPFITSRILESGEHKTFNMVLEHNGSRTVANIARSLLLTLGFKRQDITLQSSGHDPQGVVDTDRSELNVDITHVQAIADKTQALMMLNQRLLRQPYDQQVLISSINAAHDIYRSNEPVYVGTEFYPQSGNMLALQPALFVQAQRGTIPVEARMGECIKGSYPLRPFQKGKVRSMGLDEFHCLNEDAIGHMLHTIVEARGYAAEPRGRGV